MGYNRSVIKNKIRKFTAVALLAILAVSLCSCAVMRKLSAADILQHTKLDFQGVALDSVMIYPNLFPKSNGFLPNPKVLEFVKDLTQGVIKEEIGRIFLTGNLSAQSSHKDTLWLKGLKAVIKLDTIATLPVDLKDSVLLVPGQNQIEVQAIMPIDGSLFHLMEVDTLHFVGQLDVSLQSGGEIIPLEFSMSRFVSEEEKKSLKEQTMKYIVDTVVNRWLGQFKKS